MSDVYVSCPRCGEGVFDGSSRPMETVKAKSDHEHGQRVSVEASLKCLECGFEATLKGKWKEPEPPRDPRD